MTKQLEKEMIKEHFERVAQDLTVEEVVNLLLEKEELKQQIECLKNKNKELEKSNLANLMEIDLWKEGIKTRKRC